jgi:hypothetical protein
MRKTDKKLSEDKLIIGIYNNDVLLSFDNLNDNFPKGLKYIGVDIRWKRDFHPSYKTSYRLQGFYSTRLGRELDYPNTFYELFVVLVYILYEHLIMGKIGIDDNSGEWSLEVDFSKKNILRISGDIISDSEKEAKKLPIYQY